MGNFRIPGLASAKKSDDFIGALAKGEIPRIGGIPWGESVKMS